jgi:hypothetical protein
MNIIPERNKLKSRRYLSGSFFIARNELRGQLNPIALRDAGGSGDRKAESAWRRFIEASNER